MKFNILLTLSLGAFALGISPLSAVENKTLPTVTVTASDVGTLAEEVLVGPYNQPEWTEHRRFTTTRVFIQKEPWEIGLEQWYRVRHYRDGTTKNLFIEELEIGLPNRMQVDIYWDWVHENHETSHKDVAFELRWALADWGKLPLNPTLYGEYKITDPKHGADVYEVKLLLGDAITPKIHWGMNFAFENEIGGEKAHEYAVTQGISYSVIDQVLSAGVEMQFKYENVAGERDNGEHKFQVGPSLQWRINKNTHLDLVALFGCTNDSPRVEGFVILGWDFGGGESKPDIHYKPVSGMRN